MISASGKFVQKRLDYLELFDFGAANGGKVLLHDMAVGFDGLKVIDDIVEPRFDRSKRKRVIQFILFETALVAGC